MDFMDAVDSIWRCCSRRPFSAVAANILQKSKKNAFFTGFDLQETV